MENKPTETVEEKKRLQAETQPQNGKPDWAIKAEAAGYERKKTIGEKKFDNRAYFLWAGVGTFIFTIVTAFALRDGRFNVPFYKNKEGEPVSFQKGYQALTAAVGDKLHSTRLFKDKDKKAAHNIAGSAMLTTVTFAGGFIPLPFIRNMERNKAKIVKRLNEKYGTAEDVAVGEANVKDEAPQSWGSILKGRVGAWLIVFATFAGIGGKLIPNTFGGIEKDFENLAGKAGQKIHSWPEGSEKYFAATGENKTQKEANEAAALPEGTSDKQENQMYTYKRTGELMAVDVFATAMSATLLYVLSKFFANKNKDKKAQNHNEVVEETYRYVNAETPQPAMEVTAVEKDTQVMPKKKHLNKVAKRDASFTAESSKEANAVVNTEVRL